MRLPDALEITACSRGQPSAISHTPAALGWFAEGAQVHRLMRPSQKSAIFPNLRFPAWKTIHAGACRTSRQPPRTPCAAQGKRQQLTKTADRWQSGRMRRTRNPVYVQAYREFESHPVRHSPDTVDHTVPAAPGRGPQAVILKLPAQGSALPQERGGRAFTRHGWSHPATMDFSYGLSVSAAACPGRVQCVSGITEEPTEVVMVEFLCHSYVFD